MTLPDLQQIVIEFLLSCEDVTDFFTTEPFDRVYSQFPKTKVWPAVRVTQFNDQPVRQNPLHIIRASLQIEAFGGRKKTAKRLAETCRSLLHSDLPDTYDDGVITNVESFGMRDLPDETFTPAQPRWLFVAVVTAHAVPAIAS